MSSLAAIDEASGVAEAEAVTPVGVGVGAPSTNETCAKSEKTNADSGSQHGVLVGMSIGSASDVIDDEKVPSQSDLRSERIPSLTKLAFSAPTAGMLPFVVMFSLYGNRNYELFGASLATVSVFVSLARSFDVISDPLMAYITDSMRSKHGRRRPFMFLGSFAYAISVLMLMKPPYGDTFTISMWFGITYIIFFLASTFTTIPYYALGPELSRDSGERTTLFLIMSVFEGVGTLIAVALPLIATMQVESTRWNEWICLSELQQGKRCLDGHSCGHVWTDPSDWQGFKLNSTLRSVLASVEGVPSAFTNLRDACSEWIKSPANLTAVLGSSATPRQNQEFCNCMVTCDSACSVANERTGFEWVGIIFSVYSFVTMITCVLMVKEAGVPTSLRSPPLVPSMLSTLMNAPFRILLPAWACDAFVNAVVQTITPFFVVIVTAPKYQTKADHGRECGDPDDDSYSIWFCETAHVITVCGSALLLSAIIALPFWSILLKRVGKVNTWLLWSLTMAVSNLFFVFLGRGDVISLWIVAAINGLPLGAKFIADSILGDIIDYDQFLTGRRSEATYFMFKGFLPKIVQIPASAMPIALLGVVGYISPIGGVEQLQDRRVVWYVKGVVLSCFFVSFLAFIIKRQYPLKTPEHIKELVLGLDAHKQGREYPDPVTKIPYKPVLVSEHLQDAFWLFDHFREKRIRRMFLSPGMEWSDIEDLDPVAAFDIKAGSNKIEFYMRWQHRAASVFACVSGAATAGSMMLISNPSWSFVPTFVAVIFGISVVGCGISSLRLRASRRIMDAANNAEITAEVVSQVLQHRDDLKRLGVQSNVVKITHL
eukprot:TRINITY_DN67554_c0_g1_i1.p1 TRINITY_DN67554_c0_g1~~TRINITY_DN67554_c0_g1_i1.p1  ORF type:complete len:827 (+),score=109.10 TRINITY_DN67554_c0_g1_i1:56-2536(+)